MSAVEPVGGASVAAPLLPPRSTSQLAVSRETFSSSAISPFERPCSASSAALSIRSSTFFICTEFDRRFNSRVVIRERGLELVEPVHAGDQIADEPLRELR